MMVLDRVYFTGSFGTMRTLSARVAKHQRANPTLRVYADIMRITGRHCAVIGLPRVVLPIRGVA
jgi:hypothetical protein